MEALSNLEIPGHFVHARFTTYEVVERGSNDKITLGDPKLAGSFVHSQMTPLDLRNLVRMGMNISDRESATSMGPGRWIESFALPVKIPGMLEIALVLDPIEIYDG